MNERLEDLRLDALGMVKVSKGPERLSWELLVALCEVLQRQA